MTAPLMVFGRRPVLEALATGRAREVLVAAGRGSGGRLTEVLDAAGRAGVPVRRVPRERIEGRAGGAVHQGVAAEVAPRPALSEGDLEAGPWDERAVVVVLDGVTDPQNVGAIARTAEASGAAALVARRRRGTGVTPAAMKASAGALLHLPVAEVHNIARAVGRLKRAGFWAIGLEADAGTAIDDASHPGGRVALVLGSEGEGLSRLVRESCDELVSIPLAGRVASLNVSAAAAVALFVYTRRGGRGAFPPTAGSGGEKEGPGV